MSGVQGLLWAAVLLLHTSSSLPICPEPCTCLSSTLNCTYSSLTSLPSFHNNVRNLDLSHNRLRSVSLQQSHGDLQAVWLANNSITHLSLCVQRVHHDARRIHRLRRGCVSWAPALQLLSAERNQLEKLPEGLNGSKSLQVLQLSFNKISSLHPEEFKNLLQLKELHLHHNLISSLHPLVFQGLAQLRVLDVSFNLLSRLHPSTYLSLRNLGAHVSVEGNRWECDCSMRPLRRRLVRDHLSGFKPWSLVCGSPSTLAGADLLQVEDEDLNCSSAGGQEHLVVTVQSGSRIILSCSVKESVPRSAQRSENQTQLVLSGTQAGVYECASEDPDIPSDLTLQISKRKERKTRSVSTTDQEKMAEAANRAGGCNLVLPVCLSVFITFLVAFILGVIARPYLVALWHRVTRKRSATETHSGAHAEQGQYDNQAFSEEEVEGHRERRVTFSSIDGEDVRNMEYYKIQEGAEREAYIEVLNKMENVRKADDSDSLSSIHDGGPQANKLRRQKSFENLNVRRSFSSSASTSDEREIREVQTTTRSPERSKEVVQQRAAQSQPANIRSEKPVQENEEQFDFSDSSQSSSESPSRRSNEKEIVSRKSGKRLRNSESSSHVSEDEVTHYPIDDMTAATVFSHSSSEDDFAHNVKRRQKGRSPSLDSYSATSSDSDDEVRGLKSRPGHKSSVVKSKAVTSWISSPGKDAQWPTLNLLQVPRLERRLEFKVHSAYFPSDSSSSSDSEDEEIHARPQSHEYGNTEKSPGSVKLRPLKQRFAVKAGQMNTEILEETRQSSQYLDLEITSPTFESSSSSDEEATSPISQTRVKSKWPRLDLQQTSRVKRRLAFKVMFPASYSSSSSDSEEEETIIGVHRQEWESVVGLPQTPERVHMKPQTQSSPFETSSSSDSEAETTELDGNHDKWPSLDFRNLPQVNRRLEFKVKPQVYDWSSSSESEEEDVGHHIHEYETVRETVQVENQWNVHTEKESNRQTPGNVKYIPYVKRRFDIKTPSRPADSSSSSDSEDENHLTSKYQEKYTEFETTQTIDYDVWPRLNLHEIPQVNRRLEFKVIPQVYDSSSSSESEEEDVGHHIHEYKTVRETVQVENQWNVHTEKESNRQTPGNVKYIPYVKRRFDIKTPSRPADSSSSSDSEDENKLTSRYQEKYTESQIVDYDRWPRLNLHDIPQVNRRLEFKVIPQVYDSSSSSESEEEDVGHQVHVYETVQEMVHIPKRDQWTQRESYLQTPNRDFETSSRVSDSSFSSDSEDETIGLKPDKWPRLDFQNIPQVNRRLEFKVTSVSDSSSSSESEEEDVQHHVHEYETVQETVQIQRQWNVDTEKESPGKKVKYIPYVKRRLDIKTPRPVSDSSSSSDSEEETIPSVVQEVYIVKSEAKISPTISPTQTQWPSLELQLVRPIKRRLDFKVTVPVEYSSTSSESEGEGVYKYDTIAEAGYVQKQIKWDVDTQKENVLQTPGENFSRLPYPKRRLDIKAPSPAPESSTSSESEYEMVIQQTKTYQYRTSSVSKSSPSTLDTRTRTPSPGFKVIPQVKRRINFKVQLPSSSSSSSSDSEDERVNVSYIEVVEEKLSRLKTREKNLSRNLVTRTPPEKPQEETKEEVLKYPVLVKRRLDIKVIPVDSNSSSSSDSDDEVEQAIEEVTYQRRISVGPSQRHDLKTQWPILDVGHIPRIRRRLDFRTQLYPSPSSDSDPEKWWPIIDLNNTQRLRRRMDIKGPLPTPKPPAKITEEQIQMRAYPEQATSIKKVLDVETTSLTSNSSSTSDSEVETALHDPQRQVIQMQNEVPREVTSERFQQEPRVDEYQEQFKVYPKFSIKRRLDIKAPTPISDSSSSSDSEDQQTQSKITVREATYRPKFPVASQKARPQLVQLPKDHPSDSSSSSESDDERAKEDPDKWWPIVDLQHRKRLRRRLDFKPMVVFSKGPESLVIVEKQTIVKQNKDLELGSLNKSQENLQVDEYQEQVKVYPKFSIKRRLDIRAPTPISDSSSSSYSDVEQNVQSKITVQEMTYRPKFPVGSQKARPQVEQVPKDHPSDSSSSSESDDERAKEDPDKWWPIVDLQHRKRLRRRLDFKPMVVFSKGPESLVIVEKQTIVKQNKDLELGSLNKSQEKLQVDEYQEQVKVYPKFSIKRRLDIKAPTPKSDSSSSSDSEDQQTQSKITVQEVTYRPKFPVGSQKARPQVEPVPKDNPSDSSSSSESDDERAKEDPDKWWPIVDLQHRKRLRRRLDIKPMVVFSKGPESPVIVEKQTIVKQNKDLELGSLNKSQEKLQVDEYQEQVKVYPKFSIKRRLDIKAPTPKSDSSSSSDSEDQQTQSKIMVQEATYRPKFPVGSQKARPQVEQVPKDHPSDSSSSSESDDERAKEDPDKWWPIVDLQHRKRLRRRLDIKPMVVLSKGPESPVIVEKQTIVKQYKDLELGSFNKSQEKLQVDEYQEQVKLYPKFSIKRRLDIKAPTPISDSSSSSDSDIDYKVETKTAVQEATYRPIFPDKTPQIERPQLKKQESKVYVEQIPQNHRPDSSSSSESDDEAARKYPDKEWPIVDLQHRKRLRRRLDIKPVPLLSKGLQSPVMIEKQTIVMQNKDPELGTLNGFQKEPRVDEYQEQFKVYPNFSIKRRLDIKAPTPISDSSSSSDSEDQQTQSKITVRDATYRPKFPVGSQKARPQLVQLPKDHPSDSSSSSESDDERAKEDPDKWWPIVDLQHRKRLRRRLDFKPMVVFSKGPESLVIVEKQTIVKQNKDLELGSFNKSQEKLQVDEYQEQVKVYPKFSIKRRLDIKAPTPKSDSSSSSDSEDQQTHSKITVQEVTYRPKFPVGSQKARPQVEPVPKDHPSDSSSSSESDDERAKEDPDKWWPIVDLQHRKRLRRRLDIKPMVVLSKGPESLVIVEKQTIVKQNKDLKLGSLNKSQEKLQVDQYQEPFKLHPKFSIKRRLDIKAPTPNSDSSSSSDSEVEQTIQSDITYRPKFPVQTPEIERLQLKKQGTKLDIEQIPKDNRPSPCDSIHDEKAKGDPEKWWPIVDLQHRKRLRRRLDIKTSMPHFETTSRRLVENRSELQYQEGQSLWSMEIKRQNTTSANSSSSDSDTEKLAKPTNTDLKTIYRVHSRNKTSPNLSRDTDSKRESEKWSPVVDFQYTKSLKRRLDVKPSPPFPKSSAEVKSSEDKMMVTTLSFEKADTKSPPEIPKSPLPKSDSSSSDSDAEANVPTQARQQVTQRTSSVVRAPHVYDQNLNMEPLDTYLPVVVDNATRNWPLIDLEHRRHPKGRLDFRASPLSSKSSMDDPFSNSGKLTDLELQSQWATMNLGSSKSRRRRTSASTGATPLSSPLSESPYTSGSESNVMGNSRTQFRITDIRKETSRSDIGSFNTVPTSEQVLSKYSQSGAKTPTLRKQHQKSSSSSESDEERSLSSTKTEDILIVNKQTSVQSDSGRYRRTKILEDTNQSQSFSVRDRNTVIAEKTDPVTSLESNGWKKYSSEEVTPEQWWSETSLSKTKRVDFSSLSTPLELVDFSSKPLSQSDAVLIQDQEKRRSRPDDKHSSADIPFDMFYKPQTERRGFGALKAMSTERRIWDSDSGDLLGALPDSTDQQGRTLVADLQYLPPVYEKKSTGLLEYDSHSKNVGVFDDDIPSGLPPPIPMTPQ